MHFMVNHVHQGHMVPFVLMPQNRLVIQHPTLFCKHLTRIQLILHNTCSFLNIQVEFIYGVTTHPNPCYWFNKAATCSQFFESSSSLVAFERKSCFIWKYACSCLIFANCKNNYQGKTKNIYLRKCYSNFNFLKLKLCIYYFWIVAIVTYIYVTSEVRKQL